MDDRKIINRDFIGAVIEENGQLLYKEYDISYPRELVEKLTAMEKDEQSTIIDAQNLFLKYYSKGNIADKRFDYLYPKIYDSVFNTLSHAPEFFNQQDFPIDEINVGGIISTRGKRYCFYPCGFSTEKDYNQFLKCQENVFFNKNQKIVLDIFRDQYGRDQDRYIKEIEELKELETCDFNYTIKIEDLRNKFNDEVGKRTERDVKELKNDIRVYFIRGCIRFVHAISYDCKRKKLPQSILMISTENIGWTTYKYQISQIERIEVHSNFGYGSRSYSYCNLFYKDIPILPYADAVKYTSVAWQQIVNYTRSYVPQRDECWGKTFGFVVCVSNLIKKDPQKFIDEFIVGEIRQMLNQLKEFLKDSPKQLKEHFEKYTLEDRKTTFVWNTGLDKESYEIFPEELADAEKIEKITGCLFFLDNMRKLNEFIPVIRVFIDDLIALNKQITPMIDSYLSKLSEEIHHNMAEIDELTEAMEEVRSRMKKILEEGALDLSNVLNLKDLFDYLDKHPLIADVYQEYTDLRDKLKGLDQQKEEKSIHLRLRKNFLKRFEEYKDRIDGIIK